MRSSLTTNILLIVVLLLMVGGAIYNMVLVNKIADESSKTTGNVKSFTGNPRTLAQKLTGNY